MHAVPKDKPRIFRVWSARQGKFFWSCNGPPLEGFKTTATHDERFLWDKARRWCMGKNA